MFMFSCCMGNEARNFGNTDVIKLMPDNERRAFENIEDYTLHLFGVIPGPRSLMLKPSFLGGTVKGIACGSAHMLIYTETSVFSLGDNSFKQCGEESKELIEQLFKLPIRGKVDSVAVGSNHSIILTNDRQVYTCGNAKATGQSRSTLSTLNIPEINQIFAGFNKSAFLTQNSVLLLGNWANSKRYTQPKRLKYNIDHEDPIKSLSIGKEFALILTENGSVYAWGDNSYGELGFPRECLSVRYPEKVTSLENIKEMKTGGRHSVFLDREGQVFTCGDNSEGQCGLNKLRNYEPTLVKEGVRIWAGDAHTAVLAKDGNLYAWGDNTAGRIGMGNHQSVRHPKIIDETLRKNIIRVGFGGIFNAILVGSQQESINFY